MNTRFQYISIQLETIRGLQNSREIRQAIQNLPNGLDGTYDRIFEAIEPRNRKQVISMLKWLCFSTRPLRLGELAEIFILDPEKDVPFDPSDRLFSPDAVLTYLPNLVMTIPEGRESWTSEIKFTHFSIQEYLLSQRITQRPTKDYHIKEADAHLHIANSCLAYHLHFRRFEDVTKDTVYEFILRLYATNHWYWHLEKVANEPLPVVLKRRVLQVLDRNSHEYLNLLRSGGLRQYVPPLFYCASLPSTWPIRFLIENGADIDEISGNSSSYDRFALQHAIVEREPENAKVLLYSGANVNKQGGATGNALQAAVTFGTVEIAQLLLTKSAEVNAQGGKFGNALQAAASNGPTELVQLLLDKGAEINAQGGLYGNALQAAASSGNVEIAQILLAKGAEVNAQGGLHGTVLLAAAGRGDADIIRLVLDHGADINEQGGKYGNALQAAAKHGDIQAVKLLLDRGADINARGGVFGNAIQAAAANRRYGTTNLLHSRGAKLDPPGPEWEEMLSRLSTGDYLEIGIPMVQRLKKFQADPTSFRSWCYRLED